eukprot:3799397-Alexandrium_andersonii.AAC.1
MAHRVTQGLVDVEEAIGREFQCRKVVGHDWPDPAAAWGELPFPLPDDYKYLDIEGRSEGDPRDESPLLDRPPGQ